LFYCTDWSSVDSVEGGVAGVQLDGGQHGVTAGGSGHSGGSSVGHGGSGVVEGKASGVVEGEASGVGVGKAGNGGSSDHGGGSLLVSGPLAVKSRVSVGDDRSSSDLVRDLSGSDHIRLDNRDVGDSANRGEGGESSWESSSVGKTSIAQTAKDNLGVSLSGPLAVKARVSVGDDGSSSDLVGDLSGSDDIRLDNRGVGDSANGGEGGEGSSVGKTSIAGIAQTAKDNLGVSLSLLPLRSSGGGSIESSLELSLGGDNLSGVLDRCGALKVKHRGDKRSDLGGDRGHGEVGGGDSEAVQGVGHIVDSLEEAIGVDVLVTAGGHSIGVPGLGLG